MARVTVEDCVDKVPNRFDLVMLAAHRARSISDGAPIAVFEVVAVHVELVQQRQEQVGHRGAVGALNVVVALDLAVRMAGDKDWHPQVVVHRAVAHRAAVEHHRVADVEEQHRRARRPILGLVHHQVSVLEIQRYAQSFTFDGLRERGRDVEVHRVAELVRT